MNSRTVLGYAMIALAISLFCSAFVEAARDSYQQVEPKAANTEAVCQYPFDAYSKRVRDTGAIVTDLFAATGFTSQTKVYLVDIVDGSIHFRHHPFLVFVHNGCIQSIQAISDETRIYLEDFISKRG